MISTLNFLSGLFRTFVLFSPAMQVYCGLLILGFHYMPGIKVYITGEKELIMELSMKWAGNPNILVAVKAFGLRATVQVCAIKELVYLKSTSRHTLLTQAHT